MADEDLGEVLSVLTDWGNKREANGREAFAEQITALTGERDIAQAAANAAETKLADANRLLEDARAGGVRDGLRITELENLAAGLQRELSAARARIAELEAGGPDPDPEPDPDLPSAPLDNYTTLLHNFDFSKEPAGVVYSGGVATNNKATRRKQQVAYGQGPDGKSMRIRAEIIDGVLYSADVKFQGQRIPPIHHQVCVWSGGVGDACWCAPGWLRPLGGGEGEIDPCEPFDKTGITAGTLHKTPYGTGHKHTGVQFNTTHAKLAVGLHVSEFRMESTKATWWLDGVLQGTKTKAQFEAVCGAGTWATQMIGHDWYSRDTLQVGPGTAVDQTGPMPDVFKPMDFYIHSRKIYVPAS